MTPSLLTTFFQILLTPYGLIGILFIPLVLTSHSKFLPWILFGLCCFTASLGKFDLPFSTAPSLVFPLEQLRTLGRPLTIMLLGLLSLLTLKTKGQGNQIAIPKAFFYLALVQVIILLKTAFQGNWMFALLNAATLGLIFLITIKGFSLWIYNDNDFYLAVWSLALAGFTFIAVNGFQAVQNLYALTYIGGRFLGTTNNPNMAALVLTSSIPCFLFFIEDNLTRSWLKLLWLLTLTIAMMFLFLTGSRAGVIVAFLAILIFYRQRIWFLIRLCLVIGVILLILQFFFPENSIDLTIFQTDTLWERYLLGGNTRSQVSLALWNDFINNPLFGKSFQGDRLSLGESSWLTVAATLGIIGLIPMLLFGVEYLKILVQLYRLSMQKTKYSLAYSLVFSALLSLFIGSFAEAFLLGTLTFPIFTLLLYISLSNYLVTAHNNDKSIVLQNVPSRNLSSYNLRNLPKTRQAHRSVQLHEVP